MTRIGAVLATSAMGHGIFAGSPWAVGISGGFASPLAARLISASDLVLAFGAALTRWTTKDGSLIAPDAQASSTSTSKRTPPTGRSTSR